MKKRIKIIFSSTFVHTIFLLHIFALYFFLFQFLPVLSYPTVPFSKFFLLPPSVLSSCQHDGCKQCQTNLSLLPHCLLVQHLNPPNLQLNNLIYFAMIIFSIFFYRFFFWLILFRTFYTF